LSVFNPKVAVITPTIGTKHLKQNLGSVMNQSYKNMIHFIVVDGPQYMERAHAILEEVDNKKREVIFLPENTGHSNYNGHRIYGAAPYLINADYVMFLDEDNWINSSHVEDLVKVADKTDWAFSFRNIVDQDGKFICNDDCESLGKWPTCLSDKEYFLDVGAYFLPKALAVQISPAWHRRARHPEEQPEVDRLIMQILLHNQYTYDSTYNYTLNYRVGNRDDSVKADFFLQGNEHHLKKYNGKLPWKK
tara:strand:- start:2338 stop:3081 length:744 start_codon:yes stop_codon:yes gene_type:complete